MSPLKPRSTRSTNGLLRLLPCADTLGIVASMVCMVHCAVMPLLITLIPAFSLQLMHDDRTHYVLAFFVLAFCLIGVLPGYLRHSQKKVLVLMLVGLSLVLFATFASAVSMGDRFEIPLITAGNLFVVAAHYRNRKLLACSH